MTQHQRNMFTAFATGWAAGIGLASFVNGNVATGIICTILVLINIPYFISGWREK